MAERDKAGRFVKGYKGGPGRPARSKEEKYLTTLSKRCTIKEWEKIVDTAIARAKAGDPRARQWLSDYLLGRPQQFMDITSGGERLPSVIVYLPEIDDLEAESGATGEVPS